MRFQQDVSPYLYKNFQSYSNSHIFEYPFLRKRDNLYYLAKKKYVPREFVIWLSHSNLLKRYPKSLTLLLSFLSPSIHTVRRGSKIDMIRCYLMMPFSNPRLLFEKKARIFIWTKIKEKLCLRSLLTSKNNNA